LYDYVVAIKFISYYVKMHMRDVSRKDLISCARKKWLTKMT